MYLYGASGHAKVIIDILRANQIEINGLVDDNPNVQELLGISVLHQSNGLSPFIISIGNNQIRKTIAEQLKTSFGKAIHPSAIISPNSLIDEGTVVMQGAIVQSCATIGKHCIINTCSIVEHDNVIEDFVHISPHATLCGTVFIGEMSHIGANATIKNNIHIISNCRVGAGCVVVKDITKEGTYIGVPARRMEP